MVWIVGFGLAMLVMLALFAIARRRGEGGWDTDLGSISNNWLSENRAHERDSSRAR
jgi:hypothetical protein